MCTDAPRTVAALGPLVLIKDGDFKKQLAPAVNPDMVVEKTLGKSYGKLYHADAAVNIPNNFFSTRPPRRQTFRIQ